MSHSSPISLQASPSTNPSQESLMASSASAPTKIYLPHLDGIRAVAAIYVVLYHMKLTIPISSDMFWITRWFGYGHISVTIFIALSGFALTAPVASENGMLASGTLTFLGRRARRILPPYYTSLALSMLLSLTLLSQRTGTVWDQSVGWSWLALASHVLLFQDSLAWPSFNYALWSVATEWHIYLLFPVLVLLWKRYGHIFVTICIAPLSFIGYFIVLVLPIWELQPQLYPQYLGVFALGALAAAIAFATDGTMMAHLRRHLPWPLLTLLGATAVVFVCVLSTPVSLWLPLVDCVTGCFALALLVYTTCQRESTLTRILTWRQLVFVGTFSYSIYLLHAPIVQLTWQYILAPWHVQPEGTFALLVLIGMPGVLLSSYLFHLIFERPFMTRRFIKHTRYKAYTLAPGRTGVI